MPREISWSSERPGQFNEAVGRIIPGNWSRNVRHKCDWLNQSVHGPITNSPAMLTFLPRFLSGRLLGSLPRFWGARVYGLFNTIAQWRNYSVV
ncbi:hypothetical protein BH24CHL4_BH24CHL4_14520 [soil metagenome]